MVGEAISAQFLASTFSKNCDGIVILDIHAPAAVENITNPVELVSSMPEIANHLQSDVRPDFILSPDKGAVERASEVAEVIGIPFSYLEKKRIDAHTIEHTPKDLDVNGKIVAIVDDMISTGGTICRASEALLNQGAKKFMPHALMDYLLEEQSIDCLIMLTEYIPQTLFPTQEGMCLRLLH